MQKTEWWKEFFSGLSVDMWRLAITDDQTRMEADFIQKMLQLTPPAEVLDVPCGSGRLAIEFASRGFTMSGVDISLQFLDEARTLVHEKRLDVSRHQRDMRDLPWQTAFDGAFCFGNSFGYLDDDGNAQFLDAAYRLLRPAGRFILDACSVAENVLPQIQKHTEMQIVDISFIEDNHYRSILVVVQSTRGIGTSSGQQKGGQRVPVGIIPGCIEEDARIVDIFAQPGCDVRSLRAIIC